MDDDPGGAPPFVPPGGAAALIGRVKVALTAAMMRFLAERGFTDLTPAHAAILPLIDPDGTRATVLARRTGLTKQAIGQTVRELDGLGYVEQVPDPTDARAKVVRFTRRGVALRGALFAGKAAFESAAADALGEARLRELERDLERLLELLR